MANFHDLLREWGLADYIPEFEAEGINDESFVLLDDHTIQSIFKKSGPRLIFENKYKYLQTEPGIEQCSRLSRSTDDTISIGSSDETFDNSFIEDSQVVFKIPEVPSVVIKSPKDRLFDLSACQPSSKKVKSANVFTDTLGDILGRSPDGKMVLLSRKKLNNDMRQKLSKIIVNELLKPNPLTQSIEDLKSETFMAAAQEIVNLFPGEVIETYYIPYSSGKTGLRHPARGKLWSRYVNVRAALRLVNQNVLSSDLEASCSQQQKSGEENEDIRNDLIFIKSAIEPYVRVLQALESTLNLRQSTYKNATLVNIFEDFPHHHYIHPIEYIVGESFHNVKGGVALPKNYTAQFIPIRKVLINFFQLPKVLEETLHYIGGLQNESEMTNILQTDFWKKKIVNISDKDIIFPIFIYFDEFECGNPLGSHAGIHKLGTIYCSISCIPPAFQGHLENIFLTLLFHSADLKEFGKNKILTQLVEELIFLETKGINLMVDETERNIKFCLALLLGDNLGMNSILGFVESFRANYYCRFCKYSRIEMQEQEIENKEKMRDVVNYDVDVKLKKFSFTGIKEESLFNMIPSFHVTSNFCVDIAHDIFEGVALFDFTEIMYQFVIVDKIFDIEAMNSCIKFFDYGWKSNRPPLITSDNLKKKKINMSCAEMKTMILYAGLVFGHLIPVGNIHWKVYIFLRKILSIILSSSVSKEKCTSLRKLVKEHHSIYKRVFKLPLKPKHHNLLHYPEVMMNSGSLNNTSSLRYESKHREGKLSANVVSSRTNITKTLAIKHQLKICHRFLSMEGFQNIKAETNDTIQDISSLLSTFVTDFEYDELHKFEYSYLCKKLVIGNIIYKKDDTIIIENNIPPVFGNISFVLMNNEGEYCFIFKKIKVINIDEHFFAYEVQVSEVLNYTLNIE